MRWRDAQARMLGQHVEVPIVVEYRGAFANRHGRDEAIDQPANRAALATTRQVEIGGALEISQAS
jgi:hypothetical protein